MAPLQKRAAYSLVIGVVFTICFIAVLVGQGDLTVFDRDANIRLILYAVLVGVPLVHVVLVDLPLHKPTQFDERDRFVMERSGRIQWLVVTFSLVAWTIALTEIFHNQGQVPIPFLNLILFSTLILGTLGQSLGILLGYWRMDRNG